MIYVQSRGAIHYRQCAVLVHHVVVVALPDSKADRAADTTGGSVEDSVKCNMRAHCFVVQHALSLQRWSAPGSKHKEATSVCCVGKTQKMNRSKRENANALGCVGNTQNMNKLKTRENVTCAHCYDAYLGKCAL